MVPYLVDQVRERHPLARLPAQLAASSRHAREVGRFDILRPEVVPVGPGRCTVGDVWWPPRGYGGGIARVRSIDTASEICAKKSVAYSREIYSQFHGNTLGPSGGGPNATVLSSHAMPGSFALNC